MLKGDLTILVGDVREKLKELPDDSIHCVVTSPPYFSLRDYGMPGQIGREDTLDDYIATLVGVFRQMRRCLRPEATFWLNIGDTFAYDSKWGGSTGGRHSEALHGQTGIARARRTTGLEDGQLCGIPWRVALALQADGWFLRCDVVWHKTNGYPEGRVADRPTRTHEYLFLLAKQRDYYYDAEAIREDSAPSSAARAKYNDGTPSPKNLKGVEDGVYCGPTSMKKAYGQGKNKRSVWDVATAQNRDSNHYAAFPEKLIEPCILAGCPVGGFVLDPFAGSGTTPKVALKNQRKAVAIEINPDYVEEIDRRCRVIQPQLIL